MFLVLTTFGDFFKFNIAENADTTLYGKFLKSYLNI